MKLTQTLVAAAVSASLACSVDAAGLKRISSAEHALQATQSASRAFAMSDFAQSQASLTGLNSLKLISVTPDSFGVDHARFQQQYHGIPVWNARALVHRQRSGVQSIQSALRSDVTLKVDSASLSEGAAINIAEARYRPKDAQPGRMLPARASLVVFPREQIRGLVLKHGAKGKGFEIDTLHSTGAEPGGEAWRLAYHVRLFYKTLTDTIAVESIIDANSGAILSAWDGLQYADIPASGKGNSQYSGIVALDVVKHRNGSFSLWDQTRAQLPHPLAGPDPLTQIPEMQGIGNRVFWPDNINFLGTVYTDADDIWGDGQQISDMHDPNYNWASTNGQTAAVDAAYGVQTTWDFYKTVFDRNGVDDQGTSTFAVVHLRGFFGASWLNAAWVTEYFGMLYGDGAYVDYPELPGNLYTALTQLDVTGHELSHGVMATTAALIYSGESGGMNEANSDIMGTMVEFWAGSGRQGATIPDYGGNWTIGEKIVPAGDPINFMRTMYKPSLDGQSHDAWFSGIDLDDVHLSSGVGNHFFYLLSQGTDPTDPNKQSAYLPGGMTGVGNDKAARIWYRTISSLVVNSGSDYHDMREYTLQTARELYGDDSGEVAAVENAWAAVNVGPPHGQTSRLQVQIPTRDENLAYNTSPRIWVVPAGGFDVPLDAKIVSGQTAKGVTWDFGGLDAYPQSVGAISADGIYRTPLLSGPNGVGTSIEAVKAISLEDPQQYAVAAIVTVASDLDADNDIDACDLGILATHWAEMTTDRRVVYDIDGNGIIDADDVLLYKLAFKTAFDR